MFISAIHKHSSSHWIKSSNLKNFFSFSDNDLVNFIKTFYMPDCKTEKNIPLPQEMTEPELLFGYTTNQWEFLVINYLSLFAKFYIYKKGVFHFES